ncbi:transcription termination factor NusA [Zavarzinella formosa]|uniref:transcription termination factor NusA n=1 Tax=Zavarzinella formosa TaxID=360055 RepID=UPI0002D59992|nr:transcription termination factor NusA [Zavarzinella formosa]
MAKAPAKKTRKDINAEKDAARAAQRQAILTLVDTMHREKGIPKDIIFGGIESAIQLAIERNSLESDEDETEVDVLVHIDRATGDILAQKNDQAIEPEVLGRIAAQAARQVMTQKIREAESEGVFTEFQARRGELVTATVQRVDNGTSIVTLSKDGKNTVGTVEAILPRSEQIPGETHQVNDRIKAVVMDVRKQGHRVKIVLSRCHPDFVRGLFEQEIPEIQDRTIEIKTVSREAGYRSKVAVSSIDMKVDCVGACVGVRGSRIKNVIDEINGERIDIVRWNDSMQVMIPNALQPAEISEVQLYPRLGRAIVLVAEDQLSLAIGRRGQNVRLASKLVGWDIDIMTVDELARDLEKAERWFSAVPGMASEMIEVLITEGFFTYTDLTFLEPEQLAEMTGVTPEEADEMIMFAEEMAERIEREGEPEYEAAQEAAAAAEEQTATEDTETATDGEAAAEGTATEETVEAPAEKSETPAGSFDSLFQADAASTEEPEASAKTEETPPTE